MSAREVLKKLMSFWQRVEVKRWRMIRICVGRTVCRERSDSGRRGVREGQSGGVGGGSVVFDEGLEVGRGFLTDFFEGMATLGVDDDDFNEGRGTSCRLR